MIRKFAHIILSVLLFVLSTGFTIEYHYCHGHLVSVNIDKSSKSCCNNPLCCTKESVFIHLENDFLGSTVSIEPPTPPVFSSIPELNTFEVIEKGFSKNNVHNVIKGPPPKKDITVLYHAFLI